VSVLDFPNHFIADFWTRNSTVGDVARKVMGDVPINYIEGVGGVRVSEDDIVAVGKHDVSALIPLLLI
jgi:hypothetical protein